MSRATSSSPTKAIRVSVKNTMLMRPCQRRLPRRRATREQRKRKVTLRTATLRTRMTLGPVSTQAALSNDEHGSDRGHQRLPSAERYFLVYQLWLFQAARFLDLVGWCFQRR